ncbi:MAG TPA: DUF1801 domain-containing protein [Flavobacteriales bacterium]|nr:DUF1801 domain-containing protein [Flavobacteriales bacterium]
MKIEATSPADYLSKIPSDRFTPMSGLRHAILSNLPDGFNEEMSYGMLGYVVPHSLYPAGYHCNTKLPLPFINLASQKNFIALYHMGIYSKPELLDWFVSEWKLRDLGKLDMGKSCVRFKKMDKIPFDLIGELVSKMTVQEWIDVYESAYKK